MTWYKVNATALNIRKGPGASYADIGDLVRDDVIEVSETLGGWHHFVRAFRGVNQLTLADPLNSWCSGAYTVATTPPVVDPPPPVPAGPVDVLVTWSDGSKWKANQFEKVG